MNKDLHFNILNFFSFEDTKIIEIFIEQVYQFSRLSWKPLCQQNVPITIKYPKMATEIAPNFQGIGITPYSIKNIMVFVNRVKI